MRVSDAEREDAADRLRVAAGDGRLDLEELEQRLEQTYAARTYGELEPLIFDLPSEAPGGPVPYGKTAKSSKPARTSRGVAAGRSLSA